LWQRERERAEVLPNGLKVLRETSLKGKPTLMAWTPKATKPYVHYQFSTVEKMEDYIVRVTAAFDALQARKVERKLAAKGTAEQVDAVAIGDIFEWSWGYDQTNLDYFEVVARRGRMLTVRELAQKTVPGSEGFMSDRRLPLPGQFLENAKPQSKLLQFSGGKPFIAQEFGWCDLWDGSAHYCSWYA
jgi:hypothetical protein